MLQFFVSSANVRNLYRGADKSLAPPGRKQTQKRVRDARDFNNIETRAVITFFFFFKASAEGNSRHFYRNIRLFPSWSGQGLISTPVKTMKSSARAHIHTHTHTHRHAHKYKSKKYETPWRSTRNYRRRSLTFWRRNYFFKF